MSSTLLASTSLLARLGGACTLGTRSSLLPALTLGGAPEAAAEGCLASCSSRCYATAKDAGAGADESQATGGRRRRPMRYGSKLAMRDPERFRRMQAILGYPDEASAPRVDRVTINLLQTFKYCSPDSDLLEDIAAYKVTSLNRELVPELDAVERLLKDVRMGAAAGGEGPGAAAGGSEAGKAKSAR